MTDQTTAPAPAAPVTPAPPATQGESHMIPKSRLDEVLAQNKSLMDKLAASEKERQEQLEKQLAEQGEWKKVAENRAQEIAALKPKADTLEAYEKTLEAVLSAQVAEIPEAMRSLIPDALSVQQKLDWLSRNKALLVKPKPVDIGAGRTGGTAPTGADLTAEEIQLAQQYGMKPEEYAKYKK